LISVVVVNWNRRVLLKNCLDSLARQTYASYEVIIIDNGSDDGSRELVEQAIPAYPVPLKLLVNSENLGFCKANNQGFAHSEAAFLAVLNNDAEADPNWLASLYEACTRTKDTGMAASKILVWEEPSRIDKAGHLIYPDGQNRGRGTGQLDRGQFDRAEEVLWPDGCAAMYKRAMLEDVGDFDEEFFAYADDAELGLRGRIAGWQCFYTPAAVVRHHRGATLGLGSAKRLTLIERNRVLLVVKLFPLNLLWLNGAYLLARIAWGLWAALKNPQQQGDLRHYQGLKGKLTAASALLKGTWSSLPLIPSMLRKRKAFRSKHRLSPKQVRRLLLHYRISLKELNS
jgi:GT2 family glycosyltransferase